MTCILSFRGAVCLLLGERALISSFSPCLAETLAQMQNFELLKNRQGEKHSQRPKSLQKALGDNVNTEREAQRPCWFHLGMDYFFSLLIIHMGPQSRWGKIEFPFLVHHIRCGENIFPPICSKMGLCPRLLCAPQNRPSVSWERFLFPRSSVFMALVKHQCTSIKLC